MQQFVVPQFLDVEDKVIGPITVRQFIILLIAGGLVFVAYKLADFTLFLFELITIAIFTILFAFIKINGRPVHYFILNFIQTMKKPRLTIWYKDYNTFELRLKMQEAIEKPIVEPRSRSIIGTSKLAELALIVDTGGIYEGETIEGKKRI